MKINPVSTSTTSPNFKSLKYQNGIKTKGALSSELTELLKGYDSAINSMKNIDILAFDGNILKLFIKTPRFLDEKYDMFYKARDYKIENYEDGSSVGLYSQPKMWDGYKSYYNIKNKLVPTEDIGVYKLEAGTTYVNDYFSSTDWEEATPIRTLEFAKLLDSILQTIDDAENKYGMNCVNVIENIAKLKAEEDRQNIVNQIKSSYTASDNFTKASDKLLNILLQNKPEVDKLKHYSLVIDETERDAYIKDKQGYYLDEIFDKYYNEHGWTLIRKDNGFKLQSIKSKEFYYTLGDMGNRTYNTYHDYYDGGCHLSSICSDDGFKDLLKLAFILDEVATEIEADRAKG